MIFSLLFASTHAVKCPVDPCPCSPSIKANIQRLQSISDNLRKVIENIKATNTLTPTLEYFLNYRNETQEILKNKNYGLENSFLRSWAFRRYIKARLDSIEKFLSDCDNDILSSLLQFVQTDKEILEKLICETASIKQTCAVRLNKVVQERNKAAVDFWNAQIINDCQLFKNVEELGPVEAFLKFFEGLFGNAATLVQQAKDSCPCPKPICTQKCQ